MAKSHTASYAVWCAVLRHSRIQRVPVSYSRTTFVKWYREMNSSVTVPCLACSRRSTYRKNESTSAVSKLVATVTAPLECLDDPHDVWRLPALRLHDVPGRPALGVRAVQ